jgi:hypothetical protein
MTSLLKMSGLLNMKGGISVQVGWFSGLVELRYRSELMHKEAQRTLKEARV